MMNTSGTFIETRCSPDYSDVFCCNNVGRRRTHVKLSVILCRRTNKRRFISIKLHSTDTRTRQTCRRQIIWQDSTHTHNDAFSLKTAII